MAARTWPKAWHGGLHDSQQDFGVGVNARRVGGACEPTLGELGLKGLLMRKTMVMC
jgi:hypothetical protein